MNKLKPESPELLAYYWQHIEEHGRIADGCRIPRFSDQLRNDLFLLFGDTDVVRLLEVVTRMGNFSDTADLADMRKTVSRLLKAKGIRLARGKRTAPGLQKMVARLAPLLLHFGLPLATSERSRLVIVLRLIADEIGVRGDPRDELRRLTRLQRVFESNQKQTLRHLAEVFARALRPDV